MSVLNFKAQNSSLQYFKFHPYLTCKDCISINMSIMLKILREISVLYSECQTAYVIKILGQNLDDFTVEASSTYSNYCALRG
jgi:hypothetical protein